LAGNVGDMAADTPGWRDMEVGAPQIARLGMARFDATRLAMLATVRGDGSPRVSPVEPYLADGCLLVGAMAWSGKAADLCCDPRYALHSAVTDPDSGEGELKLYGRAARASPALRSEAAGAWWSGQSADKAVVFVLGIDQALFVGWDTEHGVMTVHRWSPQGGYRHRARCAGTRGCPITAWTPWRAGAMSRCGWRALCSRKAGGRSRSSRPASLRALPPPCRHRDAPADAG
jgi:hypothetical protein